MKQVLILLFFCSILALNPYNVTAQTEESRNKIQMTTTYSGKTIVTDLNSVSPTFSRYNDFVESNTTIDTAKAKNGLAGDRRAAVYLSLGVKKIDANLLQLFSKRQTKFDGSITITDTYGKNPPVVFKFTKASFESYSDQFTTSTYNDSYSAASVVITCATISINGVEMEQ